MYKIIWCAILTHFFYDIMTIDTKIKGVLVAFFQHYVQFDFHKKGEGSPRGRNFFLLSKYGFIHLPLSYENRIWHIAEKKLPKHFFWYQWSLYHWVGSARPLNFKKKVVILSWCSGHRPLPDKLFAWCCKEYLGLLVWEIL